MKKYDILFWCGLNIDSVLIECENIYQALEKFMALHGRLDDIIQLKVFND